MPKVVLTHAVQDLDRWLQGKAERAAAIESGGGSNVTDFVAHDGSNNVAITTEVDDLAAMQGMVASPPPEVRPRWRRTASSSRSPSTSRRSQKKGPGSRAFLNPEARAP